ARDDPGDLRDAYGETLLRTLSAAERNQVRTTCSVGMEPQTIMRKSSPVTQTKMSYVAHVWSSRLASSTRYWVLMPEQIDVRIFRPKTIVSWTFSVVLLLSCQKMVAGMMARDASANVLNAVSMVSHQM